MHTIEKISVLGAGIMGAGIARAIFKHGFEVRIFDLNKAILDEACKEIKQKARRDMDPDKIIKAGSLKEAAQGADLIIEAVVEEIDIKCRLFAELGNIAPPETIFASNTSSLSISRMASASGRKDRFVGLHFFNPPVIMRLIEVIVNNGLSATVDDSVMEFIRNIKKTGVKCKESPGFVVNRILIPIINEAFHLLEEKCKEKEAKIVEVANDIDSAMVKDTILYIGPFDLADLTGLDTAYSVSETIYNGFNKSPRYTPSALMKSLADKGRLGRKVKCGVYTYENSENDPEKNPRLDENGKKIEYVTSPEFKSLDLLSVMVNESFRILEDGIVNSYKDIELCMEIGTKWPKGPFILARETGLDLIGETLKRRFKQSGNNPRYEMSKLLLEPSPELECFFSGG